MIQSSRHMLLARLGRFGLDGEETGVAAYAVIEVKNGLTIVPLAPGESADSAACKKHGLVADPGPYRSYLDAYEALLHLSSEGSEEESE